MIKGLETTLFFATTVAALSLTAVVSIQEFSAAPAVQHAVSMPLIKLDPVEVVGVRPAPTARTLAPEQVALVR